MSRVEEAQHFSNSLIRDAGIHASIASMPGVRVITDRETSELVPIPADHYIDQFKVTSDDGGVVALIDVHHIGRTGLKVIFPTIIRLNESSGGESQTDIFSIDNNGNVLAHTNMKGKERTETRDTSLERLVSYEDEILARVGMYPLTPRMRLEDAFYFHKNPRK
ncbi:MAG: hypothetical protein HYT11_02755 [Candidatus Levybacteria bacterium]|nr:hypothetical protein [Candidatus Levybacteria bacterium]